MTTTYPKAIEYPENKWMSHLSSEEWITCLEAWIAMIEAHLVLNDEMFLRTSVNDKSLHLFLQTYLVRRDLKSYSSDTQITAKSHQLHKDVYLLASRLLKSKSSDNTLYTSDCLFGIGRIFRKDIATRLINLLWDHGMPQLEAALMTWKSKTIRMLESKVDGSSRLEDRLRDLNRVLNMSPQTAQFFMTGSDFLDALVVRYKIMNPLLRRIIITTTYLCLVGLARCGRSARSVLIDQLYSLKSTAEAHKNGPISANDSLVAELVTMTPVVDRIRPHVWQNEPSSTRANTVLKELESFRKQDGTRRPTHYTRRCGRSAKARIHDAGSHVGDNGQLHVHTMSLISQIKDLFPDLGDGFVAKLLDEYDDNTETVIAHLLDNSLPEHLLGADRGEILYVISFIEIVFRA